MNGWILLYSIAAVQGFLLALALRQRRGSEPGGRLMAVWMLLIGVDLTVCALYLAQPGPDLLKLYRAVVLFPFLHASLFYLYARQLGRAAPLRWRDGLHFAGYGLALLAFVDLMLLDREGTIALWRELAAGRYPARAPYIDAAMMVVCLAYVAAGLLQVLNYRRRVLERASDVDPRVLDRLRLVALFQVAIWVIALGQWLLPLGPVGYRLIYAAVALFVLALGYLSLLDPPPAQPEDAAPGPKSNEDARFPEVAQRLEQLMNGQQLYREPALTIAQLAKRSGYPEYLVSAVINRCHGSHFWDYVNRQRIKAAAQQLADPGDRRSILDIAYDCGFTSKSTFNAAFKRWQGETPSRYRARAAATTPPAPD